MRNNLTSAFAAALVLGAFVSAGCQNETNDQRNRRESGFNMPSAGGGGGGGASGGGSGMSGGSGAAGPGGAGTGSGGGGGGGGGG